ncbi:acetylornithine deacetylase [Aliikangiella sp. G2MR2-5]|uniref:acetylornithine deacetylase n=1 Tax=Aliikangiella sp. G2MR2-5 TaxID=2788943 RepID=UPI0018AC7D96|nr:acetylornithine deacetylase [Aliikangiella sp. G2MR2-5]
MNNSKTLLSRTLTYLESLVGSDTQNPPRRVDSSSPIFCFLKENLPEFDFKIYDAGDGCIALLAVRGNPKLLFNFHIDTVPIADGWQSNPFILKVRDNKAYGLGACDIKGASACMLTAANATNSDLALLFSSDEEFGSSAAIKHFLSFKHNFESVIVAEPTNGGAVCAHRGIESATITFQGKSGHASSLDALKFNAIHHASKWISNSIDWIAAQAFQFENLKGLPFNAGKINGGIKANMVASECEVSFGFRPLPGTNVEALINQLKIAAPNDAEVTIKSSFSGPALPATHSLFDEEVRKAKALINSLNLPLAEPVNFWTEASLFSRSGLTSIVYGPGDINQAHTANEWVELKQLEEVTNQYIEIIENTGQKNG